MMLPPPESPLAAVVAAGDIKWTDKLTAIGTVAAAAAAAVGLGITIFLFFRQRRDNTANLTAEREAAESRADADRKAAQALATDERRYAAVVAEQRFQLENLLRALDLYGEYVAMDSNDAGIAMSKLRAYVLALPEDVGACLRRSAGLPTTSVADEKYNEMVTQYGHGGEDLSGRPPEALVYHEGEHDIAQLTGLDLTTEDGLAAAAGRLRVLRMAKLPIVQDEDASVVDSQGNGDGTQDAGAN